MMNGDGKIYTEGVSYSSSAFSEFSVDMCGITYSAYGWHVAWNIPVRNMYHYTATNTRYVYNQLYRHYNLSV